MDSKPEPQSDPWAFRAVGCFSILVAAFKLGVTFLHFHRIGMDWRTIDGIVGALGLFLLGLAFFLNVEGKKGSLLVTRPAIAFPAIACFIATIILNMLFMLEALH